MGRRSTFARGAGAAFALGVALVACVDLFHSTEFETLCTASPNDPSCVADGAVAKPDVVTTDAADAARPHPDFCAWSDAQALAEAQRACAWLGACEGPLGESAFGPCVVRAQLAFNCRATPTLRPAGAVDAFWACLATVTSCGDVDRCVFPGGVTPCVAVPSGSSTACGSAGNEAVRLECSGPEGRAAGVEPCAMLGKTCSNENASVAICSGPGGFDCATSTCSGSGAIDCNPTAQRTFDRGVDCAGYGAGQCATSAAGLSCVPGAGAGTCTGNTVPSCDGSAVTSCVKGKETRVNCDAIGLPCDVSEPVATYNITAACIDRGAGACNVADACTAGSLLESCGRGATFKIDCTTVGLGACKINGSGRGSCTPPTN